MTGVLLFGCTGKIEPKKEEPKPPITQQVVTHAAEGTRYSEATPKKARMPLWTVKWGSSNLAYSEDGDFSGDMTEVSGSLYEKGERASGFRAGKAHIDKKSNLLRLDGKVTVETSDPPGKVLCESVVWYPDREVGEARGNVRCVTTDYTMGPFDSLMFSPKLNVIGTPKFFQERYAKKK